MEKTLRYAGAGDLPIFYKPADSSEVRKIQSNGKLLGFAADGGYDEIKIDLKQNSRSS